MKAFVKSGCGVRRVGWVWLRIGRGANLQESFPHLIAQGFYLKDAGAEVSRDAELGGGGSLLKLRLFRAGNADGDAGGLAILQT